MTQYIDKDAIVAEIERIKKEECPTDTYEGRMKLFYFERFLSFIDSLGAKEVGLEKEIELVKGDYEQVDVAWNNDFDYIAKHFFELGLNARK